MSMVKKKSPKPRKYKKKEKDTPINNKVPKFNPCCPDAWCVANPFKVQTKCTRTLLKCKYCIFTEGIKYQDGTIHFKDCKDCGRYKLALFPVPLTNNIIVKDAEDFDKLNYVPYTDPIDHKKYQLTLMNKSLWDIMHGNKQGLYIDDYFVKKLGDKWVLFRTYRESNEYDLSDKTEVEKKEEHPFML